MTGSQRIIFASLALANRAYTARLISDAALTGYEATEVVLKPFPINQRASDTSQAKIGMTAIAIQSGICSK